MKYLIEVRRACRPEQEHMAALVSRADYATIAMGLAGVQHSSLKIIHVIHEQSRGEVRVMVESPLSLPDVQRALESILQNDELTTAVGHVVPAEPAVAVARLVAAAPAQGPSSKQ